MAQNTIIAVQGDKVEAWTSIRKFCIAHDVKETTIHRALKENRIESNALKGVKFWKVENNKKSFKVIK